MSEKSKIEYVNCNLCKSDKINHIANYSYHGELLSIVECAKCGLLYVSPRLRKESEIKFFENSYYDLSNEETWKNNRLANYQVLLNKLERFCKPGKLLDVGCGFGHFLRLAQDKGWQCNGIEPSKVACDYARREGLEVRQGELKNGNFFDTIVLWDVLYYYSDPVFELKKINCVLRKEGILGIRTAMDRKLFIKLFTNLANWHLLKRRSNLYYPFWNQDWLFNFSIKNLKKLLENSGFKLIHISNAIQVERSNLSTKAKLTRRLYVFFSNLIFFVSFGKCILGPAIILIAKKEKDL